MRASHLAVLLFLLSACPAPEKCVQAAVSESGSVLGNPDVSPPLGVVGAPFELAVFAPRTACGRDGLSAFVELLGPDNYEVSDVTVSQPARTQDHDVVSVQVRFTPSLAGQHLLRASFEPSLGVRSVLIDVAESRLDPPSTRVHVPNSADCVNGVWPVAAGVVACERLTGQVELFSADAGMTSFAGEQLVVAGRAIWSVEAATSELHRHVIADGGLVLTDAFHGFSTRAVKGMHDERSALRARGSGELAVARIEDSLIRTGYQWSDVAADRVLFVDNGGLQQAQPCSFVGCSSLRGLEPEMRWINDGRIRGIGGFKRPIDREQMSPDVVLLYTAALLEAPESGFERLPLWLLPTGSPSVSVLVNSDRPQLGLSAWKRDEVLRVGKNFVLLNDPAGGDDLRVTPR